MAQTTKDAEYNPTLVRPRRYSFEEALKFVDPSPADETEEFVTSIYADRHRPASE